jgi:hypothetical protein
VAHDGLRSEPRRPDSEQLAVALDRKPSGRPSSPDGLCRCTIEIRQDLSAAILCFSIVAPLPHRGVSLEGVRCSVAFIVNNPNQSKRSVCISSVPGGTITFYEKTFYGLGMHFGAWNDASSQDFGSAGPHGREILETFRSDCPEFFGDDKSARSRIEGR